MRAEAAGDPGPSRPGGFRAVTVGCRCAARPCARLCTSPASYGRRRGARDRWKRVSQARQGIVRGRAAMHSFSGRDLQLPDRCLLPRRHGHAFIDRALYLPKGSTSGCPARLKPHRDVRATSGFDQAWACGRDDRARPCGWRPFRWVAADSVYGVGDIDRTYAKPVKAMYWASIPIMVSSWANRNGLSAPPRRSPRPGNDLTGGVRRYGNQKDHDCMTGATSNRPTRRRRVTITARSFGHVAC